MPRQARVKSPVGMYHIMFRGNNKQNLFGDDEDRLKLIELLEELPRQLYPSKSSKSRNNKDSIRIPLEQLERVHFLRLSYRRVRRHHNHTGM